MTTITGKIYRVTRNKGYGWIRTGDSKDWFFHRSELRNASFEDVSEGMEVEFVPIRDNPKGLRANEVYVQ